MNLQDSRILLTGAGSGIGRCLALQLASRGAKLALVGRNRAKLNEVANETRGSHVFIFDLSSPSGQEQLVSGIVESLGDIDMLINNAGVMEFCDFSRQDAGSIDRLIRTNLTGPLLLTHAVLPFLLRKNSGKIVNVGSTFGSIGFGHFAVYSATKFALRGFSESLRRELDHTRIGVLYAAPRATKTALNEEAVVELNRRTGIMMDEPEYAAREIVSAIETDASECYIGWPEKAYARLNAVFPRVVDKALEKNNKIARELLKCRQGISK